MEFSPNYSSSVKFLQMDFNASRPSEYMSNDIETQSRLSKEHLSMISIEDSIKQTANHLRDKELSNLDESVIGGLDHQNISMSAEDIFTTDLRFSDPMENFQNSKDLEPLTSSRHKCEQVKFLSAEVLQDFDSQNSGLKNEVVNNYLKTCSPAAFCALPASPPAGNCKHFNYHFAMEPQREKMELEMKSISISTESDPSLKSTCLQTSDNNNVGNLNPQDHFILQAMKAAPAFQVVNLILDKIQNSPGIDERMQKILGTLKEDARINGLVDNSYLTKISTQPPAKEEEEKPAVRNNYNKENTKSDLVDQLLNTYRAHYNLPHPYPAPGKDLHIWSETRPAKQEHPPPQFKRVPCSNAMAEELLLKQKYFSNAKTVPAHLLHIPRSPILCPESTCQRMIFVSDFNKHLVVDHSHLPMDRITPFQCKNFLLDARLFRNGASKCRLLYLMCDKIVGLGSTEYKDYLPLLVMTSSISLHQLCGLRSQELSAPDYLLIWVTGIAPEDLSISVSLTVWSTATRAPSCHIVYSGQMYSIRNSQRALDIWQSGRTLLLSPQEVAALTNNGNEVLHLQLSAH